MFDFIRKPLLWAALDAGLDKEIGSPVPFSLKSIQDLAVYQILRSERHKRIAEIGAGHSRLLPTLARTNSCLSVEKFEGHGGGPTKTQEIPGVQNVSAFLGEMSEELRDGSLDIVFSISVVEHVAGAGKLDAFHEDQLRILKPGGIFIHAIDMYVEDDPAAHHRQRFEEYRSWVVDTPGVVPIGDVYEGAYKFTCDLATNPDNVMYTWGRVAPNLIELRQVAQSVAVLAAGRKL